MLSHSERPETEPIGYLLGNRGMSEDGSRVFFDSPDPLVPQATSAGVRDVYEWEHGTVFLLSSGAATEDSEVLDNSPSGNDLFFTTAEGLVPADTDGAYDVYDARIPHPADNPPPPAVPCAGDVCQGAPSVPSLLGAPASSTFFGPGNPTPPAASKPSAPPVLTNAKKLALALKACRKKRKKMRAPCESRARRAYGATHKAKRTARATERGHAR